jgi:Fe-S cluster assembly protein SufD
MTLHRKIEKTAAETALAAQFDPSTASANAKHAFARFERLGLPGRRVESWHYTDVRAALVQAAPPTDPADAGVTDWAKQRLAETPKLGDCRLVLLDGRFAPSLSDAPPPGVALDPHTPDAALREDADAMVALAAALAQRGFTLSVDPATDAGRIEIVHLTSAGVGHASYSRLAVELATGASAVIFESCLGAVDGAQRHRLLSLSLGKGASLAHIVAIDDQPSIEVESIVADLAEESVVRAFGLISGGALVRRQIFANLNAKGAKIALSGLALLDGSRRADTTLEVTHAAPHGESREYFKHIVADDASGTFQGKVIVAPHAQKTDGAMKSQAILLSPTATMNNKPELEIFADDVQCGHGATAGALDDDLKFYLMARGIPAAEAEALLIQAFVGEAIEGIEHAGLREALMESVAAWLKARA